MGNYSSALIPDTEEFDSIVSIAEKLNEQVAHVADERLQSELQSLVTLMMEEERKENQSEELDSSTLQENTQKTSQNGSALPVAASKSVPTKSFTSLLPKALSAVLHPTLAPGPNSDPQANRNPPNLEQLQTELKELKGQFEVMKCQHNKEIKLLMSELDEEKRIRLTLQMEIQRMKKRMSK
ncbi:SH3 domain-containing kinase-binding protein 1 isoform X3 [Epinephelus fuscoguttatus]|uniref:SH3 domain-containing kinase-binding protein 1 isoform X2 n=1 Tax=Epinephelus lanceolatus TaxID=310571 RepID=UPI0014479C4A|nr:SH3 domain-containing kinase-binding protein 1 isoform X2 [Epinephelus lanceolatus]XP_033466061.1 SH3 domain-containing kinase-binding protein 1 isoform X2 [Epinephelus lanceolatus]XP_049448408.1 SH3 domain-containing kinase-binding protein 1 isoform X3 [Epinephelus fuscoguttatus]XP_049896417.1 SH3 domain-containing kinase-binding protein 1 isoform X2 [Epinephelus moara]